MNTFVEGVCFLDTGFDSTVMPRDQLQKRMNVKKQTLCQQYTYTMLR